MGWAVFSAADRAAARVLRECMGWDTADEAASEEEVTAMGKPQQACANCGTPMTSSTCPNPDCSASSHR